MLQEKQFYLKQLEKGGVSHRKIANRMSTRFNTSAAAIKDELLRGGYIVLDYVKREGETRKFNHYFKLTGKKLNGEQKVEKEINVVWDDGTPKSKNNAFDWRKQDFTLYNKREIVHAQQKHNHSTQIHVYSKA